MAFRYRCSEVIPAPVESVPAQPIIAVCPLCGEERRYLPSQVFQGHLSWKLMRKPVRSAGGYRHAYPQAPKRGSGFGRAGKADPQAGCGSLSQTHG
jgi:hypothetical protein